MSKKKKGFVLIALLPAEKETILSANNKMQKAFLFKGGKYFQYLVLLTSKALCPIKLLFYKFICQKMLHGLVASSSNMPSFSKSMNKALAVKLKYDYNKYGFKN